MSRACAYAHEVNAIVAIARENVAAMRREHAFRFFQSQNRACDIVARVPKALRAIDVGIADNACFKGFPRTRC